MASEAVGLRRVMVSHLFTFLVASTAVFASAVTIDIPQVTALFYGLLILGHGASILIRALPLAVINKRLISTLVVAVVARVILVSPPAGIRVLPMDLFSQEDLPILAGVTYLLLCSGFFLTDTLGLLWLLVPCIAVFGLVGQLNVNVESLAAFLYFLLFMIAMLGWLHFGPRAGPDRIGEGARPALEFVPRIGAHLYLSSLLFLAVALVAFALGRVLVAVTPAPFGRVLTTVKGTVEQHFPFQTSYLGFSDTLQVGAGPQMITDDPVLYVKSDREAYWRVRVYPYFTGFDWVAEQTYPTAVEERDTELALGEDGYPLEPFDPHETLIDQTIIVPDQRSGYLPAAASVSYVRSPWAPVLVGPTGSLMTLKTIPPGGFYHVVSRANTLDPAVLRASAKALSEDVLGSLVSEQYLDTSYVSQGLARLVNEIVREYPNAFDRVMVLQRYLEDNCVYDLSAPRYSRGPSDMDVASQFVLVRKEGACSEFATALALMCRVVGIPARVATGYTSGTYDRASDVYVVRERDTHAWAEVFFPTIGWVPFSPTPTRVSSGPVLTRMFTLVTDASRSFNTFLRRNLIWLVLVFPLAWAVGYANAYRLTRIRRLFSPRPRTPRAEAARMWRDLAQSLSRLGPAPAPSQGPKEYLDAIVPLLGTHSPDLSREVQNVADGLVEVLYGPDIPERSYLEAIRRRMRGMRRALSRTPAMRRDRRISPEEPSGTKLRAMLHRIPYPFRRPGKKDEG